MNELGHSLPDPFSNQEQLAFQRLRARYQDDSDRFSESERAQLQFMRWLFTVGRLDPHVGCDDSSTGGSDTVAGPPHDERDSA